MCTYGSVHLRKRFHKCALIEACIYGSSFHKFTFMEAFSVSAHLHKGFCKCTLTKVLL